LNQAAVFSAAFVLIYSYVAFAHRWRGAAVWAGAGLAMLVCTVAGLAVHPVHLLSEINWNVLLIFSGILVIAEVLIEAGIPSYLAARIISVSKSYGWAALLICGLSSLISVFVENVATVMIVAPVALEVARKHRANPVVLLIGIAVASNLQGTATLVGDPPSMILAASENMSFNDFFFMDGRPGIFWAVQIGAVASFFVLYYFLGRDRGEVPRVAIPEVASWTPAWILTGVIAGLAVLSLFFPGVGTEAGLLCLVGGLLTLGWHWIHQRRHPPVPTGEFEKGARRNGEILRDFDLDTLMLLAGIFFMVAALSEYGVMEIVGRFIAGVAGNNPLTAFVIIVCGSMIMSAIVDNVPFVTAMIPVTWAVVESMGGGSHYYLTFGLLVGSCLGGNISPVGASANIVAVSMLRRQGHRVSFMQFVKVGLPFTLAATAAGALFIWLVWHP
jgi:Na+/H+ antiporter NhaD/arsenite permease-like protein